MIILDSGCDCYEIRKIIKMCYISKIKINKINLIL